MSDRWAQISGIYHDALARTGDDRDAFLREACRSDAALRREIDSLLEHHAAASSLLGGAEVEDDGEVPNDAEKRPGELLGVYTIDALIGAGGMGRVYRARDPRLQRDVAIKVPARRFSGRFQREAQIVAQLNHPYICTLYDVGPDYLVMEYVQGKPLAGPLPPERVVEYAGQICEALECAHRGGVVHRDLKPSNLLVTKQGIKLLDFGIARMPGQDRTMTDAGLTPGTPLFMAPELWYGAHADVRSDIFALGKVITEMVTGDPDSTRVLEPPALNRVVRKCVERDPADRWQTAREVRLALELVQPALPGVPRLQRWATWLPWAVAMLALSSAGVLWWKSAGGTPPPASPPLRTTMPPPDNTVFEWIPPAISPDGRTLAFVGSPRNVLGPNQLWVRALDALTAQPLAGTNGAAQPFWSPDSRFIGFFAEGKLKTVSAAGGPVVTLASAVMPRGGSWSDTGVIVFATSGAALQQVSDAGGPTRAFSQLRAGENSHRWPWFLPGGGHVLYGVNAEGRVTIRVRAIDSGDDQIVEQTESSDGDTDGLSNAVYSDGHLLFLRRGALMARPFDLDRLRSSGTPVAIADRVQRTSAFGGGVFGASATGLLVYKHDEPSSQFVWFDRHGTTLRTVGEPFTAGGRLRLSPDGTRAAISVRDPSSSDRNIWIYDTSSGNGTRFTSGPHPELGLVWSPDGEYIVFNSTVNGQQALVRKRSDLSGAEELIHVNPTGTTMPFSNPMTWSDDGKHLIYGSGGHPWLLSDPLGPAGAVKASPLERTPSAVTNAAFAPGGGWLTYQSTEGRTEIWATPFPGPGSRVKVSTAGGSWPQWGPGGKEIFYIAPDGWLMTAAVTVKDRSLTVGGVTRLFPLVVSNEHSYAVSSDGKRILAIKLPADFGKPFVFLQNWKSLVK